MQKEDASMQAAVLTGPGQFEIRTVPMPVPGPTAVRVRLEGCGVCGSNLSPWEGRPWFEYPFAAGAPGHEGWGTVDVAGAEVTSVRPGDRVALLSTRAFAEYDLAEAASVVPIPASLRKKAVPGEALGCAFNVFRRSEIAPGQTVAVIGVGFLGALVTHLAARAGARVIAISRRPMALEIARRYGAAEAIPMDDHARILSTVRKLTGGRGCECVIEAVGHQWPLDLGAELTCERGRLVIAGYHQDGPRQVNMQLWNWRGLDVINAHERDPLVYMEGMRAAIHELVAGTLDPKPLFTHSFPLAEISRAFTQLRNRPDTFFKALIAL